MHGVNGSILPFLLSRPEIVRKFEDFLCTYSFVSMMICRLDVRFERSGIGETLLTIGTRILRLFLKLGKLGSERLLLRINRLLRSGDWLRINRLIHLQVFLPVMLLKHLGIRRDESAQRALDDVSCIFSAKFFHDLAFEQTFAFLQRLLERAGLDQGRIGLTRS